MMPFSNRILPGSKSRTIYALLSEGPATSAEIVDETGWSLKLVGDHLRRMLKRGEIQRSPCEFKGQRSQWLWSVPNTPSSKD